jgi:ABC-type sugar transport system permease subunit
MGSFGLFNERWLCSVHRRRGPAAIPLTPLVFIYTQAFGRFRLGRAAAAGYIYFIFIFVLTLVQLRFVGREEE